MAGAAVKRAGLALPGQATLAVGAGLAHAASLAWPAGGQPLWGLQFFSMLVLAWLVCPRPGQPIAWRRGALLGWLFATAWLVGTFWWLFISMHDYGGLAAPLAVAAVLALAVFLGSYHAVALGCFCRLAPAHPAHAALLFGAMWLLAELARGTLWTGFPWGASGYAHVDGPLAALARYVGVYGIGAVAAALAMGGAQWRRTDLARGPTWAALLTLGAALLLAGLGRNGAVNSAADSSHPSARPLRLELLQGNIPQDEKFLPGSGVPLALTWYAEQLRAAQGDLVVAPETAIPLLPQQLVPGYLEDLQQRYQTGAQAALVGIPLGDDTRGYTNSVVGWGAAGGAAYQYDKHHLVPFGEFIPPFFKWFTAMMDIPLGDFNRGAVGQPSFVWAGQRIAPNICYEDLFGEELGARFLDPAQAPTVFVNVSNIGWFGNTLAIDQHLHISRMRTLEFERPMVRATNTGATAIIDHRGVVTHQLERHTRGVLRGEVIGRGLDAHNGGNITPYAWWVSRWGLWPLWALCAVALLAAALARWARPAPGH